MKRARVFAVCSLLLVGACTGKDPYNPGRSIGVFHVTGALVSTSCGDVPNPWEFDVRLRHDERTIYWVQGGAPISGQMDAAAKTAFRASDTRTIREADARKRVAACVVTREDVLDVVLADASKVAVTDPAVTTTFVGSLTYRFSPGQGSDCNDQLLDTGGDFAALPCEVKYDISATRTGNTPN